MKKLTCAVLAAIVVCTVLTACGNSADKPRAQVNSTEVQFIAPQEGDLVATITTTMGDISLILYPQYAPMAVENFTQLAQNGYYNSNLVHRVLPGFAIQTGDAGGTGLGGSSIWGNNTYPDEYAAPLRHYAGAVALVHAQDGSLGNLSQFYIVQSAEDSISKTDAKTLKEAGLPQTVVDTYKAAGGAPYLDGQDTVFGQVYSGMDIVDAIAKVECDENARPVVPIVVQSITIHTYTAPQPDASSAAE